MRKTTLAFLGLLSGTILLAQNAPLLTPKFTTYPNGVSSGQCTSFEITRPFSELAAEQGLQKQVDVFDQKEADKRRQHTVTNDPNGMPQGIDPNVQSRDAQRAITPPGMNWTAQNGGGNSSPLDPNGSVGLTAYTQVVNSNFRAWSKTTGSALMASLNLSTLWGASFCDPVCLYDKAADRWFIGMLSSSNTDVLCAVSNTNNPSGAWTKWTFTMPQSQIDYPKWSVWQDGYYLGMNLGTEFLTAFDRVKMLAGNASASFVTKNLPNTPSSGFFCPMPADADGILPPANTPCYFFTFEDDNWAGSGAVKDQIHIFKMTTNFTTPANTTVVEDVADGSPLVVTPFNSNWNNYGTEISQKGSTQGLDAIQGIFMFRAQFRVWTGYNTVVLNNAVNVNTGTGQSGIRWYELRQDQSTKKWTIFQQGTYAPDTENRWMGSIAMDGYGNIGMGYAKSGTNTYPSLCYTGRLASDPLGSFTFGETTAKAGAGAQSAGNRWGDYSNTSIDPTDDATFWHTGMYAGSGGSEQTQVFNFKITPGAGINENADVAAAFTAYPTNNSILVKGTSLTGNNPLQVDLFDIDGKLISGQKLTPAGNSFETSFNSSGLAKGTYLVRIGNVSFQNVLKVILN
jgi:hypothetical protein